MCAAPQYAVVKMSQETQVISSGTLMDKSGEKVVGESCAGGAQVAVLRPLLGASLRACAYVQMAYLAPLHRTA